MVTYVATTGTGWPGSFIEYRLLDGPEAGCYVYYAEGVNPAPDLRVGHRVAAGQPIATIISGWETGIEIGWGAGTGTTAYAAKARQWDATSDEHSSASPAGKSFSALVASLAVSGREVAKLAVLNSAEVYLGARPPRLNRLPAFHIIQPSEFESMTAFFWASIWGAS